MGTYPPQLQTAMRRFSAHRPSDLGRSRVGPELRFVSRLVVLLLSVRRDALVVACKPSRGVKSGVNAFFVLTSHPLASELL